MPKVLHIKDDVVINEYPVTEGSITIGRGGDNNIQLDDGSVSTHHAAIKAENNPYMDDLLDISVDDLGSTNGTRCNGRKIESMRLKHGDEVQIGNHRFKLVDEASQLFDSTRIYLPDEDIDADDLL